MPDEGHTSGTGPHLPISWLKKVDKLWDWMIDHQRAIDEWWKQQWRWNKDVLARIAELEKICNNLVDRNEFTTLENKVDLLIKEQNKIVAKVVGASVIGGAVVALLGLLAAFGLKLF